MDVLPIDRDNTNTHIYTYLFMDTWLEFKELFLLSVLAYNSNVRIIEEYMTNRENKVSRINLG